MPAIEKHPAGAFSWIELASSDQNAAKTFYTALFDYSIVDFPMGPSEIYTMFQLHGKDVGAAYTMDAQQAANMPPHWNLYIAVDNADEAAALATSLGGAVFMPPFDVGESGRMAVLHDPTGAFFNIWQPKNSVGIQLTGEPGTLCWADLNTNDPPKAKAFYEKMLHWRIEAGEHDPSGYLHIKNGGQFIGGIPPAQSGQYPNWLIYLQVADIDATTNKAQQLGGSVMMPPTAVQNVGRMAILADPQGAAFAAFAPA